MKKIILPLIASLATLLAANANERPVRINQLPAKAQHFLTDHFASHQVSYAKYDNDLDERTYSVVFTDGTEIDFSRRGEWLKIDCKRGTTIPEEILLPSIVAYLNHNHPGESVVEVERERRHWEVELTNGLEITFDNHGHIKYYD